MTRVWIFQQAAKELPLLSCDRRRLDMRS
jgi:hypothetical protein